MATYTWKKCLPAIDGLVMREEGGCIVLDSYVTGSDLVMITLPISCLEYIREATIASSSVNITDHTIDYGQY